MDFRQEFNSHYKKWKVAVNDMPHYSKSTAYTQLPEYRDIIALGMPCIPLLKDKLKKNKPLDFFLTDAVIEILDLDPEGFNQTDLEKKRVEVLEKLNEEK